MNRRVMPCGLDQFVCESNRIEGIFGITVEEVEAHRVFLSGHATVEALVSLVAVLQPDARLRDSKAIHGVRVGSHVAPPSGPEIYRELKHVLMIDDPWKQHISYETLHPFTDGNGRSGRALWLHRHKELFLPIGFLHAFYYQTLEHSR